MARNSRWDTEKLSSHAPRAGAREPGATAATGGVEGASAAAEADTARPDLLGSAVKAVDELAAFAAGGATGDGRRLAPPGIQALLGVEESTPTRSAHDQSGPARADFADEPRQSALGRAEDPRRAAEAGPNGVAGDGVEVHASAPAAAVAGVASVSKEPRQGSHRLGFLHGTHGDVSSALRACGAEPRPAPAGAFQRHRAPDRGMDGAATAPGVRPGGGSAVS